VFAFAPSYDGGISSNEDIDEDALVIEGKMYGACEVDGVCASFRLVNGKSYNYLSSVRADVETGRLSSSIRVLLNRELTLEVLEENAQRVVLKSCASEEGGIDYNYVVTREGETYELDTCSTTFAYNEDLQERFFDVWFALENPDTPVPSSGNKSTPLRNPFDIFWDRFHASPQEAGFLYHNKLEKQG
jgi:hypothetical protein